jgi:hypothetical protein
MKTSLVSMCWIRCKYYVHSTYQCHLFASPLFSSSSESVYPFSFLQIHPLKCRYEYCVHQEDLGSMDTQLEAMHGWLGSMTVCCTPMVRLGKWQVDFHRPNAGDPEINIDQSKNLLEVERGNDLLAALCIAYAFDKALCQPLVTIIGYQEKEHPDDDDDSVESYEDAPRSNHHMLAAPPEEYYEGEEDEEVDAFEPAGYLGYEDTETPEEDPEISGYLEAEPNQEDNDEEEFVPDGYLEGQPDRTDQDTYEPDGYLEDGNRDTDAQDSYQPDGYLEDASHQESYQPDGYLQYDDKFEDEH